MFSYFPRFRTAALPRWSKSALSFTVAGPPAIFVVTAAALLSLAGPGRSQISTGSIARPWSGYGHDPQHTGISYTPAAAMGRVKWQTPVDLDPQYTGTSLLAHYGSPLVTAGNTVAVTPTARAGRATRRQPRA